MRTTCCWCTMMRVLMLVARSKCCKRPSQWTRCSSSKLASFLPASSRPMTPSKSAEAFSAVKLRATFAAPPGMKLSRSKSTTGTGASGEMRETQPQMNWSSMTSPTTSTRVLAAARKIRRTRLGDRNPGFMAGRVFSFEERSERTRRTCGVELRGQTDFKRRTARFNRHLERDGHANRIARHRDGRVDQRGIGAQFHRFGGVTGRAQPGIDHDRHRRLLDDDANLVAGLDAAIRTDRRTQRHDGRRADVLQAFGQNRIGIDVRKHDETFLDQKFRGLQRLDRIRQEIARVGMDF